MLKIKNINLKYNSVLVLFIIIGLVFLTTCKKERLEEDEYVDTDMIGVIIRDKSTLRLDPILYSSIVSHIRHGEEVKVLTRSREKSWIGNTSDYWYRILHKGKIVGWTYGANIKVFSGEDKDDIDDFLTGFWKREKWKMRKKLAGRWWSIDKYDNFTNQCLELYKEGTYKSYCVNCTPIEGDYKINFNDYEIIFLKGTYIGDRVNYKLRGDSFILKKPGKNANTQLYAESETLYIIYTIVPRILL